MSENAVSEDAIVVERTFDAPAELIWRMWTDAEHFKQWYGPKGFTVPVAELDVRVDGKRLVCMESPDGSMKMWTTGEHLVVTANERLVYTESMSDENGAVISPSAYGMDENTHPTTTEVTVALASVDGKTQMTLTHAGLPAEAQGAGDGWGQAFDKLADLVASLGSDS